MQCSVSCSRRSSCSKTVAFDFASSARRLVEPASATVLLCLKWMQYGLRSLEPAGQTEANWDGLVGSAGVLPTRNAHHLGFALAACGFNTQELGFHVLQKF